MIQLSGIKNLEQKSNIDRQYKALSVGSWSLMCSFYSNKEIKSAEMALMQSVEYLWYVQNETNKLFVDKVTIKFEP